MIRSISGHTVPGNPVASRMIAAPIPWVISRTASATLSVVGSMACVAPIASAMSRRTLEGSDRMTFVAPECRRMAHAA